MDLKLQRVNSLVSGGRLEVVFSVIWNFSRNVQYFGVCRQETTTRFILSHLQVGVLMGS
jgi:hypothetical protein